MKLAAPTGAMSGRAHSIRSGLAKVATWGKDNLALASLAVLHRPVPGYATKGRAHAVRTRYKKDAALIKNLAACSEWGDASLGRVAPP